VRCNGLKKNKTCCCVAGLVIKITGISIFSVACVTSDSVGLGRGEQKPKKERGGGEGKEENISQWHLNISDHKMDILLNSSPSFHF